MTRHFWSLGLAVLGLSACSEPGPDTSVQDIDVTSPVEAILDKGRSHQFTATARDASGQTVNVVLSWESSNPSAAGVGGNGMVSALAPGSASINAFIPAEPATVGALAIRVVDADLETIAALSDDAFAEAVLSALSAGAGSTAQSAWNACATHAADGNITAIQRCVTDLRTQAGSAADGNDRALLTVLGIFGDQFERRLAL